MKPFGSPAFQALNAAAFATPIPPDVAETLAEYKDEGDLLDACCAHLAALGYERMTADNACANPSPRGWYGHLVVAKGNPFMADLIILSPRQNRSLMVECKVRDRYQPGQRQMIEAGAWVEVRTAQAFAQAVTRFEARPVRNQ